MAFLLLIIPPVRTGVKKVPYWLVYGIKMLARMKNPRRESAQIIAEKQGVLARTSALTAA